MKKFKEIMKFVGVALLHTTVGFLAINLIVFIANIVAEYLIETAQILLIVIGSWFIGKTSIGRIIENWKNEKKNIG